jgi:hypothetical protein
MNIIDGRTEKRPVTASGDDLIRDRLFEFAEIDEQAIESRVSLLLDLPGRKSGLVFEIIITNANRLSMGTL